MWFKGIFSRDGYLAGIRSSMGYLLKTTLVNLLLLYSIIITRSSDKLAGEIGNGSTF
jgi:hypothetical protein